MSGSVKKALRDWLMLSCGFLTGGSAGSFLFDPCRSVGGRGDIEGHQAMLTDQAANFSGMEIDERLRADLASIDRHLALVHPAANGLIGIRADDGQERLAEPKTITDANLDLSILVTQRHAIPSRLITALRYRQLYAFQNQFCILARIDLFSCLSMHRIGTSATQFGSISCPRPLVLRTYASRALVSAPADPYMLQWRDRFTVPQGKKRPPSPLAAQYSMEHIEGILYANPEAVTKLLAGIFKPNHLTRAERESIARKLDLPIPAQRPVKTAKQYDGGLPLIRVRKASA
jgi:hypothetical protein